MYFFSGPGHQKYEWVVTNTLEAKDLILSQQEILICLKNDFVYKSTFGEH